MCHTRTICRGFWRDFISGNVPIVHHSPIRNSKLFSENPNPDLSEADNSLDDDMCLPAVVATEAARTNCDSGDPLLDEAALASKMHQDRYHGARATEAYRPQSSGGRQAIVGLIESAQEGEREMLSSGARGDREIARGFVAAQETLRRLLRADLSAGVRLVERQRLASAELDCVNGDFE